MAKGTEEEIMKPTTIESFTHRATGVRVFMLRDILERLASICDETGASISTVANAALKVALEHPEAIYEDIEGVKTNAAKHSY